MRKISGMRRARHTVASLGGDHAIPGNQPGAAAASRPSAVSSHNVPFHSPTVADHTDFERSLTAKIIEGVTREFRKSEPSQQDQLEAVRPTCTDTWSELLGHQHEILTIAEAHRILGVDPKLILSWIHEGMLNSMPYRRDDGRIWHKISRQQLRDFLGSDHALPGISRGQ